MKDKLKSALQRIIAGALALVFAGTIALPKAEAVTGVDDVSVGIMAVLVHLESIGGSLAVQQGTALATQNAVIALATQAGAAGALGAGVTGTAALATIGGAVTVAAAGGFTIGYVGYQQLSKLAEWIRKTKLTGTAENAIYTTGGSFETLIDGSSAFGRKIAGEVYTTQGGSTYWVNITRAAEGFKADVSYTFISSDNIVKNIVNKSLPLDIWPGNGIVPYILGPTINPSTGTGFLDVTINVLNYPLQTIPDESEREGYWKDIFVPNPATTYEKQEVTYMPPITWTPPVPTTGQDVYYNPYPNAPQKPIKEIVEDVPKDIYDKKFDPAPPSILDPSIPPITPPAPDIPTVNPNPDVTAPDDVKPYTVRLGDVFPFCIPFDIYHMVTLFAAEPEAPHAKWEFSLPFTGGSYEVEWDLREWDEVAALCRKLELILFCVGLAVVTSKLIKW